MSQLSKGIFGTIAVSLTLGTLGAVQLASGRDLIKKNHPVDTSEAVNRAGKADRAPRAEGSAAAMRTISLRLERLADTSVVIRLPVLTQARKEARNVPAPSLLKSQARKSAVACEPPVSVLTEVAKQLEPGRCVT